MRFWDSSAVIPLIVREDSSEVVSALLRQDGDMVAWWGTRLECVASLNRRLRDGSLSESAVGRSRSQLGFLSGGWVEVQPSDNLRDSAEALSKHHPLKAADSLQLAAALRWREGDTEGFVCLDRTLCRAATDEGFEVMPEAA